MMTPSFWQLIEDLNMYSCFLKKLDSFRAYMCTFSDINLEWLSITDVLLLPAFCYMCYLFNFIFIQNVDILKSLNFPWAYVEGHTHTHTHELSKCTLLS